jgi:hypothetical protein
MKTNNLNKNKITWVEKDKKPRNIYSKLEYKLEPIKVLYKYKNNNRKNQYITYIYLGVIGKRYEKILKKIEDLDLYNSLITLSKEDELKLIDGFGELWMTKFFNIYHISGFVNKLIDSKGDVLKKKLLKKYDNLWISNFINKFNDKVIHKKVHYSFSELIENNFKNMMGKKIEKFKDDLEDLDLNVNLKGNNILNSPFENLDVNNIQLGGNIDSIEDKNNIQYLKEQLGGDDENLNIDNNEDDFDDEIDYMNDNLGEEETDDTNIFVNNIAEDNDDEIVGTTIIENPHEVTNDDIEKLYQTEDIDKNINKTGTMLSNILNNEKIIEKKNSYMIKFDNEDDNNIDNQNLGNIYKKKFIYNQFIYKDDNLKTIKKKLCATIKGNDKFSKENYLLPTRIYLWSEYLINNKIDKVMLGQTWYKKNELLDIDVEPLKVNEYENLEGVVKNLNDILRRYTYKIRREDDDNNILLYYQDYMLNDTIFMIDIYNELGQDFNPNDDQLKNLTETYFKVYFPKIKQEEIIDIINFLNKKDPKKENILSKNTFDTLYNDLLIEREITDLIEKTKVDKQKEYLKLFDLGNFITQSTIKLSLKIHDEYLEKEDKIEKKLNKNIDSTIILPKLDLFRIFNDFSTDETYPFIQYQVPDSQIIFKYDEKYMYEFSKSKENMDMVVKWFENTPYGISFKVKITSLDKTVDKFMAININEIGKVDYKTQWKEKDSANIYDIINSYNYVKDLVNKINKILENHPRKIKIKKPEDHEFKFAFINCVQKFSIPDNKIIDHNDLSDFCVFFYPYISLVIEPRKRLSKVSKNEFKSKWGTYLRFKRVNKFENDLKIEQKILSYIKNFDFEDDILAEQISKQFNITNEKSNELIESVRNKFSSLIKTKKPTLKKNDNIPRFKAPGVSIDIQGKIPEKYMIRISGARDQNQLERMITFMNILIFLYSETYIKKNPEYQNIKEKLRKLTNIAKRRNKVTELVKYETNKKNLKQMIQNDKKRLGFKPEEGQNQWSRSCQNSGNDKRRRPSDHPIGNLQEMIAKGYVLNKKTNEYEKKIKIKNKGRKDTEIVLKALKTTNADETTGNVNEIYYTCDPKDNGEHMYVGFLTRSNNPFGECMPCCFKKNPFESTKKEKIEFYKQCLSDKKENVVKTISGISGDILYILQDTNKIQEGRISYLPKFIDLITNVNLNKSREIKNHYLLKTESYFFRLGINQDNYSFLNTISNILNLSDNEIKNIITKFLRKDTTEEYYISLNEGDIRTEFRINDFIRFIQDEDLLDYYYMKDLLKIPGLFTKNGILTLIFDKDNSLSKKGDDVIEDFYLDVDKSMVNDFKYTLNLFDNHDILILIKDGKYYYPIIEIIKEDENSKNVELRKLFNKNEQKDNKLIEIIQKFFIKTIEDINIDNINIHISAKETFYLSNTIGLNITHQAIDSRFKTKFLITKNNFIIPVLPSGIVANIPFICFNNYEASNDCFSRLNFKSLEETQEFLEKVYNKTNKFINIKPIGLFYDNIKDNYANIIGIMTSNNELVPIKQIKISIDELNKNKMLYKNRPLYYELDNKLVNYNKVNFNYIDQRIINVNKSKYLEESYNLFRFELSNLITSKEFLKEKNELLELIKNKEQVKLQKKILELCVSKINDKIINKNLIGNELVKIINELPNLDYYKLNNQREICSKLDDNDCETNLHCTLEYSKKSNKSKCKFALTEDNLYRFIKRLSMELCDQEIKVYELFKEKKYYVSDIVNFNNFTERKGQKIIKSTNTNLQKFLSDIFGKEHIPKIGKRYLSKKIEIDLNALEIQNPLKDIKDAYSQNIISYNLSIIRAYINGFYWIKHKFYTNNNRNLGYYSELQNEMINIFRSLIIDWLNLPDNIKILYDLDDKTKKILLKSIDLNDTKNLKYNINKYIIHIMENNLEINFGYLELLILNYIHDIKIIIIINGVPTYLIDKKIKNINDNQFLIKDNICISLDITFEARYPNITEINYYN